MKKLSSNLSDIFDSLDKKDDIVRKAYRAAQVRSMWADSVDNIFLEHTNSVYLIKEENRKILIVYVDESIFAAELNARRELIKLKFLQLFNEDIDEFKILISKGSYKKNYPFKEKNKFNYIEKVPIIKLSAAELSQVEEIVSSIENEEIKGSLKRAIIADREWKKGRDFHSKTKESKRF